MIKLPTLKQLQHVIALFDYQHFAKAAEACFISQSTMSASISQFEEILGVQLLERDHKTFIFTSMAEEIVARCRIVVEGARYLMEFAQNQGKPMHGTLRVGCIPTIAPFILGPLLTLCQRQYPALKLLIREDTSDNLLNLLESGQMDLVILALPYITKNLHTEILCEDPFMLVSSVQWQKKIADKEIHDWPDECIFLLEQEHCLTTHALQACALQNSKKINPFFATSLHTLTYMIDKGLGVTFLPRLAIDHGILENTSLQTRPLPGYYCRKIGLAWRPASQRQDCYRLFAEVVKSVVQIDNG